MFVNTNRFLVTRAAAIATATAGYSKGSTSVLIQRPLSVSSLLLFHPHSKKQQQQQQNQSQKNTLYFSTDSSSTSTTNIIINAVGIDRVGIVSDISKVINQYNGNVNESIAGRLGGNYFSLMMFVTIPTEHYTIIQDTITNHIQDIDAAIFNTTNNSKLNIDTNNGTINVTNTKKIITTPIIGYTGKIVVEGADNPGIVSQVTTIVAKNNLNIDQLQTEQEIAPYGGTVLFKMTCTVVALSPIAKNFNINKIKNDLSTLGDTLNCTISLNDHIDDTKYEGSFYAG